MKWTLATEVQGTKPRRGGGTCTEMRSTTVFAYMCHIYLAKACSCIVPPLDPHVSVFKGVASLKLKERTRMRKKEHIKTA